jgi:hypothetical protein
VRVGQWSEGSRGARGLGRIVRVGQESEGRGE